MKIPKVIILVAFMLVVWSLSIFSAGAANSRISERSQLNTDVEQNVTIVKRFLTEVVNGGKLELIDEFWAPEMVWHGGSLGDVHGIEAYKKNMQASVGGAFSGMYLDIKDIIASGDKVVVRFTNSGNFVNPFMGIKPTYKKVEWDGIGIYQIKNEKIVEAWFTEDIINTLLRP
jgi:predicted ester cyclase